MFCGKCGAKMEDDAKFCIACGAKVEEESSASVNTEQVLEVSDDKALIEADEQILGKLGNGYFVNLLYGNSKKCHALLTNKRIYLRGTMYSGDGKTLFKTKEERILDLEDVTGTGFVYTSISWVMIVFGIIALIPGVIISGYTLAGIVPSVIGIILIALAIIRSRGTLFFIEYAGGKIKIDASIIGISDVQDFHKQIRRAKSAITGKK